MSRHHVTARIALSTILAVAATLFVTGPAGAAPPAVDFTSPAQARVGTSVTFTATGADPAAVVIYAWDFGDSTSDTVNPATHAYSSAGTKTVTLTATDASTLEVTTVSHTLEVIAAPTAAFTFAAVAGSAGRTFTFDASGSTDAGGIASYAWGFGDGGSGSGPTPSHAYAAGGNKTVTLTTTSAFDGRTASVKQIVHVNNSLPVADFTYAPAAPRVGATVTFTSTATDLDGQADIVSWRWDLNGDGNFGDGSGPKVTRVFTVAGGTTVSLKVTDKAGAVSVKPLTVNVFGASGPAFSFSPLTPEIGQPVAFVGVAPPNPSGAVSYSWDFGDGSSPAVTATPSHSYATAGDKTVTLTTTEAGDNRKTSASRIVHVNSPSPPVAGSPAAPSPPPPPGATVTFETAPTGPAAVIIKSVIVPGGTRVRLRVPTGVRVQVAGSVVAGRTRFTRFVVLSPAGARIVARCKGRGCPARGVRAKAAARGRTRLRALERTLRAGAQIVITVAKKGFMTKQVVLTVRRGRAPGRKDACVSPGARAGTTKIAPCPTA